MPDRCGSVCGSVAVFLRFCGTADVAVLSLYGRTAQPPHAAALEQTRSRRHVDCAAAGTGCAAAGMVRATADVSRMPRGHRQALAWPACETARCRLQ